MKDSLMLYLIIAINIECKISSTIITKEEDQFPFFVQFFHLPDAEFNKRTTVCGATLIHPQWILSAAHCFPITVEEVAQLNFNRILLAVIHTNRLFGISKYSSIVSNFHKHPKFAQELDAKGQVIMFQNNIAVGRLQVAFKLGNRIKLVYLPKKKEAFLNCKTGMVVKMERVPYTTKVSDYVKYQKAVLKERNELGEVDVLRSETVFFSEESTVSSHEHQARSGGPYLCNFDSQMVQYGVVSYAISSTDEKTLVTVYEAVQPHLDFILNYVPKIQFHDDEVKGILEQAGWVKMILKLFFM